MRDHWLPKAFQVAEKHAVVAYVEDDASPMPGVTAEELCQAMTQPITWAGFDKAGQRGYGSNLIAFRRGGLADLLGLFRDRATKGLGGRHIDMLIRDEWGSNIG